MAQSAPLKTVISLFGQTDHARGGGDVIWPDLPSFDPFPYPFYSPLPLLISRLCGLGPALASDRVPLYTENMYELSVGEWICAIDFTERDRTKFLTTSDLLPAALKIQVSRLPYTPNRSYEARAEVNVHKMSCSKGEVSSRRVSLVRGCLAVRLQRVPPNQQHRPPPDDASQHYWMYDSGYLVFQMLDQRTPALFRFWSLELPGVKLSLS
ncbi:hypothetical protein AAG570_011102 [Ranatra chinensis]|uniref:Uncharacterized protein n=1 Tax=Ranatra chinensis TaxID=642074 RepID=A0ABD0YJW7_9HEMI